MKKLTLIPVLVAILINIQVAAASNHCTNYYVVVTKANGTVVQNGIMCMRADNAKQAQKIAYLRWRNDKDWKFVIEVKAVK